MFIKIDNIPNLNWEVTYNQTMDSLSIYTNVEDLF